ncbi:MAG: ATP-dependent Clp protease proteolytic subunit [Actinomycetota bacterium]|nr:ATP-dependent Clp protease proteolytic subunit [Actinomycetota bacterium]
MAKMSTGKIAGIVIGSLLVLFLFCGGCFILGLLSSSFSSGYSGGANIYQIRIDGVISASSQASLLSGQTTTPEQVMSQLEAAERDRAIKAILLRINSPGGSPAASQEIYEEIKRASKPVVVSVADTCACRRLLHCPCSRPYCGQPFFVGGKYRSDSAGSKPGRAL